MKNIILFTFIAIFTIACGTVSTISASKANSIPVELEEKAVYKEIKRALTMRGWTVEESSNKNIVLGVLKVRTHSVSVSIEVTKQSFKINYVDSHNMNYNPQRNTIHRNYGRWISYLERDIIANLSVAAIK